MKFWLRPSATDGASGVIARVTSSLGVTVKITVEFILELLLDVAVMAVVPTPGVAAIPTEFIVATLVLTLDQVTPLAVIFPVELFA